MQSSSLPLNNAPIFPRQLILSQELFHGLSTQSMNSERHEINWFVCRGFKQNIMGNIMVACFMFFPHCWRLKITWHFWEFLYLLSVSAVLVDTYSSVQCISSRRRSRWFAWAKQKRCLNKQLQKKQKKQQAISKWHLCQESLRWAETSEV